MSKRNGTTKSVGSSAASAARTINSSGVGILSSELHKIEISSMPTNEKVANMYVIEKAAAEYGSGATKEQYVQSLVKYINSSEAEKFPPINKPSIQEVSDRVRAARQQLKKIAPDSVKINGKTFKFVDGVATISMYDKQSRITALANFAKEHGLAYRLEEGKKIYYK